MRIISSIFFFLTYFTLFSQKETNYLPVKNLKEVEQKLYNTSINTNTIKSDFVQIKHLAYLDDTIVSKGKFWFKKDNLLRWEYTTPFSYIIVSNNGKFIIKDNNKTNEYDINSNKAFGEVNNLIISSVKGTLLKDNKFEISALKNSTTYLIKLVPKNSEMKNFIQEIDLYFNISDSNIYKVKMIENEEDYTIISFINRKINETIPANIFSVN